MGNFLPVLHLLATNQTRHFNLPFKVDALGIFVPFVFIEPHCSVNMEPATKIVGSGDTKTFS